MKRAWNFLQVGVGLALLAAFTLVLVVVFRAVSGGGAAGALQATPLPQGYPPSQASAPVPPTLTLSPEGYPPSLATALFLLSLPAPEATARDATARAEATAMIATMIVEMTASAPGPLPTPGPLLGPQTVYDPKGEFSLRLFPGWRASLGDVTVITNYDTDQLSDVHGFPPGGLKIQLGAGQLPAGQSFEQWQASWIALETSPTDDWPGQTATEPVPYILGRYEGFSYFLNGEPRVFEIHLPLSDGRVMDIQLMPADSPALKEALDMLSALEIR